MIELTPKGVAERKWGWLPALRSILESKRAPDRSGTSTVLDHLDELHRLIEIEILVHENRELIIEGLRSESRELFERDLQSLQGALRQAQKMLRESEEMLRESESRVRSIMTSRWAADS